ncbi:hypothetical protein M404DRAFT_35792 [Pisolithus tinctorius Marx 270]|uniref:Uncharacterized protein n=1 Tax=Pisolithus tinctorius Marx 270 TaxID=870435 RepID=A0A0C3NDS5_PISTI|nr:hypothetical protein M404DRAFT_35792 [Pisolithus tinctorius Marx 270]
MPSLRSAFVSAVFVPANTPLVGVLFLCVGLASGPSPRPCLVLELVGVGPDLTRMAELERTGRGWKRPQSEAGEDKNEEADKGAEGDNEEEEEVRGEKEGGEEQEGDGGQAMEE